MKKLYNNWDLGLAYLISDCTISFYTFFTIIFAECIYLQIYYSSQIIIPFTIILIGYIINVLVCAFFKTKFEGTKLEIVFSIIYLMIFVILFIIGCFIDIKTSLIMTILPFIITSISYIMSNHYLFLFLTPIIVGGPFIAFTIILSKLPTLSISLKIIIPIIYVLCVPFISYIEENSLNIFELAYYSTYNIWYKHFKNSQNISEKL